MKRKLTYKILCSCLAFLLMISSTGLGFDAHFCDGHIKRISLIGKAKSCAELYLSSSHCKSGKSTCKSKSSEEHEGCCKNESYSSDSTLDFLVIQFAQELDVDLEEPAVQCAETQFELFLYPAVDINRIYDPPKIIVDIPIQVQSILI